MPQSLIRTPLGTAQALQVQGRPLVDSHAQLASILKNRLGHDHGELLAQPQAGSDGLLWRTALAGTVERADALPDDQREALLRRVQRLQDDIRQLAGQMRAEGPSATVVAQMLESALQQPAGPWLYRVGGKPVQVLWGHGEAGSVASVPVTGAVPPGLAAATNGPAAPTPVPTAAAAPLAAPGGPGAPPTPPRLPAADAGAAAAAAPAGGRKMRWLLAGLALLLLVALGLGLRRCASPGGADGLATRIAEAEARNQALQDRLAQRPGAMQCVPDEPAAPALAVPAAPPASAEVPPPAPAPTDPPASRAAPAPPPPAPAARPAPPPAAASRPPPAVASAPAPAPPPTAPPAARPPVAQAAPEPAARPSACRPRQPGDEPELVMVFDASGSMREPMGPFSRMQAAQRAAEAMVRGLPADVDVGLVDFTACGQVRRDRFYPGAERPALIGEINGLAPKAGTPLAQAIERAGRVASDSADSVLVVVSDGADSCGGDPCGAARALKARKPNVVVNVIDLSQTPAERQMLQCVAQAGGGRLLRPGDVPDLNRKMKEAAGSANCPP